MRAHSQRAPVLLLGCLLLAIAPCAGQEPASTAGAIPPVSAPPITLAESAGPAPVADHEHGDEDLVARRLERRGGRLTPGERGRVTHTILESSRRYDVSPALVLAVIEIESAYNPHAVSPVGARGLMQLMPRTGQELAERTGERWRGTNTLFEPELNVRLGVAYLRELIDRYDSVRAALAAYNWGPGRIDGFLRRGTGLPAEYPDLVLGAYSRVGGSPIGS